MASVEFSLGGYMRARLETWEDGVDTANNTSVVHARIKVWRTNSWGGRTYSSSVTRKIQIGSQVVCDWAGEISHYVSNGEIEVASGQRTVTHNSDGTRTITVQAWLTDNAGSYFTGSGSLDMALTTIARQVNISSVTGSFTNENLTPTVNWTNNGNRVDIKIELPTLGVNPWKRWNNKQGSSSFSPTFTQSEIDDLMSRIPNTNTLTMRYTVVTVINGTDSFFSYIDKTFTIINGNPTFSNYTYADTNSTTTGITGNNQIMISGKSALSVTISAANKATAKKSATMSRYTFQVAGLTGSEDYTTSAITKALGSPTVATTETPSATRDLVVSAIDSRGLQTAVTKTITIVPYASPTISATATRANGFENTTTVKISGTFSRIEVGGAAKNTVNSSTGVRYRYRQQGSSTWGSWVNRTATIDTAAGTVTVANFDLNLNNQAAFEFEFQITDKLETTTVSLTVSVGQPAFYIGTDGRVGVGGMPTQSKKTGEAGLLQVMGRIFADNLYPVGSIYMTTTMTSASQVNAALGGTWVAWGAGRVPVGMGSNGTTNYNTVEATGGAEAHRHDFKIGLAAYYSAVLMDTMEKQGAWSSSQGKYSKSYGRESSSHSFTMNAGTQGGQSNVTEVVRYSIGDTDTADSRQPYITCYMYKRTA